jgi:hypothetical protein
MSFQIGDLVMSYKVRGTKGCVGVITKIDSESCFPYYVRWINEEKPNQYDHQLKAENLRKVD